MGPSHSEALTVKSNLFFAKSYYSERHRISWIIETVSAVCYNDHLSSLSFTVEE